MIEKGYLQKKSVDHTPDCIKEMLEDFVSEFVIVLVLFITLQNYKEFLRYASFLSLISVKKYQDYSHEPS